MADEDVGRGSGDPPYLAFCKAGVRVFNLGGEDYTIEKGDRIAQLVVARYEPVEWEEGDLGESKRGGGGFGSSGR